MTLAVPDEYLDSRTKGLWLPGSRVLTSDFVAARHEIFDGPFSLPLMLLKRDAVRHNVAALAEFCTRHGLYFAPHGKTSMAPRLYELQLAAGAWGISLATANQVLAARGFGVSRIVLANELLDPPALRWVVAELDRDPSFEFCCYVDSLAGVEAARAALEAVPGRRDLTVLVELGYPGGRTGVRGVPELLEVAKAAHAVPRLSVAGVAGYEGGLSTVEDVTGYLGTLRESAEALVAAGSVRASGPVLVSAGGSAYFDAVADVLAGDWLPGRELRVVLRSGAYITHDDGYYTTKSPLRRIGEADLHTAIELWARVNSVPEPGRAFATLGKRDTPFDEGPPMPRQVRHADGRTVPATDLRVTKLNDQHAYFDVPPGLDLAPGDLVSFGISHPCTAFDKWRVLPMVDDGYRVVDMVHTYF
ncbi:MAG: alanine racemase [Actinocatenispora sp.]